MIEFKAECGHTVRAKDQDAGRAVRCSYCGKQVSVPDSLEDDLDFLFEEVGGTSAQPAIGENRPRRRARVAPAKRGRKGREFDPFSVAMKMGYAAVLVIVVFVVAQKFVIPLVKSYRGGNATANAPAGDPVVVKKKRRAKPLSREVAQPRRGGMGLASLDGRAGLYVASTPPGATVFFVRESQAPRRVRLSTLAGCSPHLAGTRLPDVSSDKYVVEVAFPWTNKQLNQCPGFLELRRAIEDAGSAECERLVSEYFLPDNATEVLVDKTADQTFIVRQYRSVEVLDGRWTAVRSLFLPRITKKSGGGFDLGKVIPYLPDSDAYTFDAQQVDQELEFYGVATGDRRTIHEFLAKIGVVPYMIPDERVRFFKIRIESGDFRQELLEKDQ